MSSRIQQLGHSTKVFDGPDSDLLTVDRHCKYHDVVVNLGQKDATYIYSKSPVL